MDRYHLLMSDVVTRESRRRMKPRDVLENVRRYVRSGSIIVFHDSLKARDNMLWALPRAIRWLRRQGYSFGTL